MEYSKTLSQIIPFEVGDGNLSVMKSNEGTIEDDLAINDAVRLTEELHNDNSSHLMDNASILSSQRHLNTASCSQGLIPPSRDDLHLGTLNGSGVSLPLDSQQYYDPLNHQPIMICEMPSNLVSFDSSIVPYCKSNEKMDIQMNISSTDVYSRRIGVQDHQPLYILPDRLKNVENEKFLIGQIYDQSGLVLDNRHSDKDGKYDLEMTDPLSTNFNMAVNYENSSLQELHQTPLTELCPSSTTIDSEVALTLASLGNPKNQKIGEHASSDVIEFNSFSVQEEIENVVQNSNSLCDKPTTPVGTSVINTNHPSCNAKPTLVLRSRRNRGTSRTPVSVEDPEKIVKKKKRQLRHSKEVVPSLIDVAPSKPIPLSQEPHQQVIENAKDPQSYSLMGELLKASKHCEPASLIPEGVVNDVIPAVGYRIMDMCNLSEMIRMMHRCSGSQAGSVVIQEQASLREGAVSQLSIICTGCQEGTVCATSNKETDTHWGINTRIEKLKKEFNIKENDLQRMLEILGIFYRPSSNLQKAVVSQAAEPVVQTLNNQEFAPIEAQGTDGTSTHSNMTYQSNPPLMPNSFVRPTEVTSSSEPVSLAIYCESDSTYNAKPPSKTTKKNAVIPKARNLECTICKKKFQGMNYLNRHMDIHNSAGHNCPYCHAYFKKSYNLKEHINKHENKKYDCTQCGKSYSDRSTLLAHVKYHHEKIGGFICEYCSKKFSRKSHYTEHLRLHTKEKPFSCDLCGKRFSWHDSVKKHMVSHVPGTKYKCRLCGKLFRWLLGVRDHLKLRHKLNKSDVEAQVVSTDANNDKQPTPISPTGKEKSNSSVQSQEIIPEMSNTKMDVSGLSRGTEGKDSGSDIPNSNYDCLTSQVSEKMDPFLYEDSFVYE